MKVEYVSHGGDCLLVVNAARASFSKESKGVLEPYDEELDLETRQISYLYRTRPADKDIKLLSYLARESHLLPFRHPSLTVRCTAPIFVARQLGKSQVGLSWSEESRRYIKTDPEFYWPDKWRKAADNVKQGSSNEELTVVDVDKDDGWKADPQMLMDAALRQCLWVYKSCINSGMAPEQARMILPQNMETTWVWTGTLLAWAHFLKQRLEEHTQKETRDFAAMIATIVQKNFPYSYEALKKHGHI